MVIYSIWDFVSVFFYGFVAGLATPFIAMLIASSVGRSKRGE
jgi:hypothetical protein